jgi:hypothetical protein
LSTSAEPEKSNGEFTKAVGTRVQLLVDRSVLNGYASAEAVIACLFALRDRLILSYCNGAAVSAAKISE